jgi:hypothetical protein
MIYLLLLTTAMASNSLKVFQRFNQTMMDEEAALKFKMISNSHKFPYTTIIATDTTSNDDLMFVKNTDTEEMTVINPQNIDLSSNIENFLQQIVEDNWNNRRNFLFAHDDHESGSHDETNCPKRAHRNISCHHGEYLMLLCPETKEIIGTRFRMCGRSSDFGFVKPCPMKFQEAMVWARDMLLDNITFMLVQHDFPSLIGIKDEMDEMMREKFNYKQESFILLGGRDDTIVDMRRLLEVPFLHQCLKFHWLLPKTTIYILQEIKKRKLSTNIPNYAVNCVIDMIDYYHKKNPEVVQLLVNQVGKERVKVLLRRQGVNDEITAIFIPSKPLGTIIKEFILSKIQFY